MLRIRGPILILMFAAGACVSGCSTSPAAKSGPTHTIANFRQVTPEFYCGAQPNPAGLEDLEEMGVKTIVNLRTGFLPLPPAGESFEEVRIPVVPVAMTDAQVEEFLRTMQKAEKPVFVHCTLGADRTGAMVAAYRLVVQGWSKEDALREMTEEDIQIGLFCHGLVAYVREMDVEAIRKRLGIAAAGAPTAVAEAKEAPLDEIWASGALH